MNQKKMACFLAGLVSCTLFLNSCASASHKSADSALSDSTMLHSESETSTITTELTGSLTVYLEQQYTDDTVSYPIWNALQRFEAENPNLTIKYVSPPTGDDMDGVREATITQMETEIMSGGGPDLFLFGWRASNSVLFPDLQKAMRNGSFLDCMALMKSRNTDVNGDAFWPGVMASGQVDGRQYVVPLSLNIPVAVAAESTLKNSGFNQSTAMQNTEAFYAELARVYQEKGIPSYNEVFQTTNMAQPMLDYDTGKVNFSSDVSRQMLTIDQENLSAVWNQGRQDFQKEYNVDGAESFAYKETQRLTNGQRLIYANRFDCLAGVAWALADADVPTVFLPVPNENGSVTANVDCYAAINANAANPQAAAALIAFLLEKPQQDSAAWQGTLPALAVRRESLASSIESNRQFWLNIWWLDPTEEQKQAYFDEHGLELTEYTEEEKAAIRKEYGSALREDDAATLSALCAKIGVVHLQDIWDHAVNIGANADGDDLMNGLYNNYLDGVISLDELIDQIDPRLQLYLDE